MDKLLERNLRERNVSLRAQNGAIAFSGSAGRCDGHLCTCYVYVLFRQFIMEQLIIMEVKKRFFRVVRLIYDQSACKMLNK